MDKKTETYMTNNVHDLKEDESRLSFLHVGSFNDERFMQKVKVLLKDKIKRNKFDYSCRQRLQELEAHLHRDPFTIKSQVIRFPEISPKGDEKPKSQWQKIQWKICEASK